MGCLNGMTRVVPPLIVASFAAALHARCGKHVDAWWIGCGAASHENKVRA
jgi:hypothetical protein